LLLAKQNLWILSACEIGHLTFILGSLRFLEQEC
jgi:hypothetical protein